MKKINKEWVTIKEAETLTRFTKKQIRKFREKSKWIRFDDSKRPMLVNLRDLKLYEIRHPEKATNIVWGRLDLHPNEILYPIKGYDYMYCTTSEARILNLTTGEELDPKPKSDGYCVVRLTANGKSTPIYAHCLIADTQITNYRKEIFTCPKDWHIHHINVGFENRRDRKAENLLPCLINEHKEAHRLWNEGHIEEYYNYCDDIKKRNTTQYYKIPANDISDDDNYNHWLYVTANGKKSYDNGDTISFDDILTE